MMAAPKIKKFIVAYNDIHKAIHDTFPTFSADFVPDYVIAIGTGGFLPARILRSFYKRLLKKTVPLYTIGLNLYEDMGNLGIDNVMGTNVVKVQWLNTTDPLGHSYVDLLGKKILIVDEIDDTRATLSFAVEELWKDIDRQAETRRAEQPELANGDTDHGTVVRTFVVHNKVKPKRVEVRRAEYFACVEVPDVWVFYPWDSLDIHEHDKLADAAKQSPDGTVLV
ncbi:PRTase-like protein [Gonapodya prolifera JEL478]|uniref:PRTase-like protein n=1 Tax=Gonapodya prolifera (strain JEL478) TaxID=1344416 RepID=A0A139AH07_GONPJ|nr:PRTase-like protein [Gonapodya prolifera JEL478]|eukprot:KXS16112.1 PRTase-like protein [Gonapodya prolifera JEL478]